MSKRLQLAGLGAVGFQQGADIVAASASVSNDFWDGVELTNVSALLCGVANRSSTSPLPLGLGND